jgi:Helix-turn-helix domain
MPGNNKSAINERRQKLFALLTRGMKGYEIAKELNTNESTISRDINRNGCPLPQAGKLLDTGLVMPGKIVIIPMKSLGIIPAFDQLRPTIRDRVWDFFVPTGQEGKPITPQLKQFPNIP